MAALCNQYNECGSSRYTTSDSQRIYRLSYERCCMCVCLLVHWTTMAIREHLHTHTHIHAHTTYTNIRAHIFGDRGIYYQRERSLFALTWEWTTIDHGHYITHGICAGVRSFWANNMLINMCVFQLLFEEFLLLHEQIGACYGCSDNIFAKRVYSINAQQMSLACTA